MYDRVSSHGYAALYVGIVSTSCSWGAAERKSENHSSEEAIAALRKAGIAIDSCLTERSEATSGGASKLQGIADEELVANTLHQIENLLNSLVEKAPEGPYTARRLEALTGMHALS